MASLRIEENDPIRIEIANRSNKFGIIGNPDKPAHSLGKFTLSDGNVVDGHVIHAADAIIEDGNYVVMIYRTSEPSLGKPCLPRGFLDYINGRVETAIEAAICEAKEEVSIDVTGGKLIGKRYMYRPFDVRIAYSDMPQYEVKKGDIFTVSTQGVHFHVPNLSEIKLIASDDAEAGSARRIPLNSLKPDSIGIPDHFDMIVAIYPNRFS